MTRYNTGNSVQFIQFIFQSNFSIKFIQHRGIGPILFAGTLTQRLYSITYQTLMSFSIRKIYAVPMNKMAPYKIVLLYALLFVVVTSSVTSQEDKADPPLPELPDQFYMNIEANINSFNQTIYLEEIYDGPGNRGAAFIFYRNTTTFITYDYNNLQQISVTWAEGEYTYKINVSTYAVLG